MMTVEGRRRSFYGRTRDEVARKLREAQHQQDQGLPATRERQTLAQWVGAWLEMMQPPRVAESTYLRYTELLRLHVVPKLGKVVLTKLTPQQVQSLYAQLLAGPLSSSTVGRVHTCLFGCLETARRMELVARNVCELVERPRDAEHDIHPLTEEQVHHLLATAEAEGDPRRALWVVAIATGMRKGELQALRWHDVHLADGSLQVRASLRRQQGVTTRRRPKTKRSERRIALGGATVEALRAHRARQLAMRMEAGPAWEDHDAVFCDEIGRPLAAKHILWHFRRLLQRAGLPAAPRFHDLRHTAATLLLGRNVNPKIVSEMLGHASIAITLDTYSHVLPNMQQEAAAVMDQVIRPGMLG
jgi:integrase